LEGGKKNLSQSGLKKIMDWRNAFAHGKLQHDNKSGCFVRYHSGEQKKLFLTDEYWNEVERVFTESSELLKEARANLRKVAGNATTR
jgi:hypothetical protein